LLLAVVNCISLATICCVSSGDSSTWPTPTDPEAAYLELSELEGRTSYAITYKLNERNDLRRARAGSIVRWDDAFSRGDVVAGSTAISADASWNICLWSSGVGAATVDVSCELGEPLWVEIFGGLLSLNEELLEVSSLSASRRVIADEESQCFEVENFVVTGTVCYSRDGLPLLMDVRNARGGTTQTAVAVEIENTPTESEVGEPLVSEASQWFSVKQFDAGNVTLPPLPKVKTLAK
jgi:hypothetical protein